jgi:uncharacterized membrane protein YkvA (DUF1232 family)
VTDKIDYEAHAKNFDETSFWSKLAKIAKKAGRDLVEKALWLFYAAQSPGTPTWAKTTIYGALAYLVLPTDLIPDFIPVIGLADDAGAIAAALGLVTVYVDDEVKAKASEKILAWFGA